MFLLLRARQQSAVPGGGIVNRLFYTPFGQRLVSVILGFGLAMLFQRVCRGDHCTIHEAPSVSQLEKVAFAVPVEGGQKCYKYQPEFVTCVRP